MLFFGEQMRIDVPEYFKCLSNERISEKYPGQKKPQIVMIGKEEESLAFTLTDRSAENGQLESILNDFSIMIRQRYPANIFLDKGKLKLQYGNLVWTDFRGDIADKNMYYLLFLTIINKNLMIGIFQCELNQYSKQKKLIIELLSETIDLTSERKAKRS